MRSFVFILVGLLATNSFAQNLTLENVESPSANTSDEQFADEFSLDQAARFLDQSALNWTKTNKCFTCHTNFVYLQARPLIDANVTAHQQVRQALEEMVNVRWEVKQPRWDAEVVMSAAVLAMNDEMTTGQLDDTTRKALDRMWTVQREDGGFDWLKCNWPPMEIDDDYGIAMAAMAAGSAPDNYLETEQAKRGVAKLRGYLKKNPPPTLHHAAMLIWSESYGIELLTDDHRTDTLKQLRKLQLDDGGWATASLADWQRADKSPQVLDQSDAYGTAFVVYVLRRSGAAKSDATIKNGITWLKKNQRKSGRWFARSLYRDSHHYLSHAASAFAVMAIQSCEPKENE